MAFSRAPQYSAGRRITRKPRRKVVAGINPPMRAQKTGPGMGHAVVKKPRRVAAPKPVAPTPTTAPVTPVQEAVPVQKKPPPIPTAIPLTAQGTADRIAASEGYNSQLGGINAQLMEAAMRYGDVPKSIQFGYEKIDDPNAPGGFRVVDSTSEKDVLTNTPNSAVATIGRNMAARQKALRENQNAQNTFFSGMHLAGQREEEDEAGRQRIAAKAEYDAAVRELTNALLGLQGSRNEAFGAANAYDLEQAKQTPPEASDEPPPDEAPAAPAPVTPADVGARTSTKRTPAKKATPKKKAKKRRPGVGRAIGR